MNITKEIKSLVEDIVLTYAKYDKTSNQYYLRKNNVPDFQLNEIASLILRKDPDRASEALGQDNHNFEKLILPALINYMEKETDKDSQIKFLDTFRECITEYLSPEIDKYLEWGIDDYNQYRKEELRQNRNVNYLHLEQGSYL